MSEAEARKALVQALWSRCDALFYASPEYKRTWHYAYFVVLGGAVRRFKREVNDFLMRLMGKGGQHD